MNALDTMLALLLVLVAPVVGSVGSLALGGPGAERLLAGWPVRATAPRESVVTRVRAVSLPRSRNTAAGGGNQRFRPCHRHGRYPRPPLSVTGSSGPSLHRLRPYCGRAAACGAQ